MRRRAIRAVLVVPALVLPLAGCGGTAQPAGRPAPGGTTAAESAPRDLRVGLTEWTITLAGDTVAAGRIRLQVTNAGGTTHDLVVEGQAGEWHSDELRPGERDRLRVVGRPGETLELWCDEPGHEAQGMHTTLRVAG